MRIAVITLSCFILASCGELTKEQKAAQAQQISKAFAQSETAKVDGLAIMIVVDVSGSMGSFVEDADKSHRSKLEIAKRNVTALIQKTHAYSLAHPDKKILLGIVAFDSSCTEVLSLSTPNLETGTTAVKSMSGGGGTAIGDAMIFAKKKLDETNYSKIHIVTVTDGENGWGHDPEVVAMAFSKMQPAPAMYLIGFDVNTAVFNGVKNAGCLVVGANDGEALQRTLNFVFDSKILAEKEE